MQANVWETYNSDIVSKDVRLDNLCDDSRVPGKCNIILQEAGRVGLVGVSNLE